jgi:hypothetical protein
MGICIEITTIQVHLGALRYQSLRDFPAKNSLAMGSASFAARPNATPKARGRPLKRTARPGSNASPMPLWLTVQHQPTAR